MHRNKRIRLSKKDTILKAWLISLKNREENISRMIVLSIYYYLKTGEYAPLGTVGREFIAGCEVTLDDTLNVFMPDSEWMEKWCQDVAEKNATLSAEIKRILKGGLRESESTSLTSMEELEKVIDNMAYAPKQSIVSLPEIEKTVPEPKEEQQKAVSTALETKKEEVDEPEGMMDRLFMGTGFG